jgi:hypothetical protein
MSKHVMGLSGWQEHRYEGYRAVPADVTAFWRPALKNCPSKHFHPGANRALPAVIFGITGVVGEINGQRLYHAHLNECIQKTPAKSVYGRKY